MNCAPDDEWLETAPSGAFATGTVSGIRARRYHNVLMHAESPSAGRLVLVAGFDAWLTIRGQHHPITQQRYQGAILAPSEPPQRLRFDPYPWPQWTFQPAPAINLHHELFIRRESSETILRWYIESPPENILLNLRPFLVSRDYHALRRHDPALDLDAQHNTHAVSWRLSRETPAIHAVTSGLYHHEPDWFYNFEYEADLNRGFDAIEDAASPGLFQWSLNAAQPQAVLILRANTPPNPEPSPNAIRQYAQHTAGEERRRRESLHPTHWAATQFIVRRGNGASIIAGYPWFTDWGRDTFIAIRGLCIATGQLETAGQILLTWAESVSEGMLPNLFPDGNAQPEYNSVDASLWFVVAAHEFLQESQRARHAIPNSSRDQLHSAIQAILHGYANGTRYNIHAAGDGLLAAGEQGVALTWMDACVEGQPVTPRIGKPVEVQCLWLNALAIGQGGGAEWGKLLDTAKTAFQKRFWLPEHGYLNDVVDRNHTPMQIDSTLRPNQVFAAGGLPFAVITPANAKLMLAVVEEHLLTPAGLRTLAPSDPNYHSQYTGGPHERDRAYHQGTVWPWLMGPFTEAWLRVREFTPDARRQAQQRFLAPLEKLLQRAGLGHISEIASAGPPHALAGCPFQAWSLGEFLRLKRLCEQPPPESRQPWI